MHTYQHTGSLELESNAINFMFIIFSALAGNLIKKLTAARQMVDEQYGELALSHTALKEAHEQLRLYAKEVGRIDSCSGTE